MSKKKLETALQVYVNDAFGKIRCMLIDGKPYFVGKDVATALGYTDTKQAVRKHVDEEDKLGRQIDTSGQRREMTLINESGLYSLILSSKLESAKAFKRWVTSEVLPSIRETGTYTVDKDYQRYIETRKHGKQTRKAETDVIKLFIEYARNQGCNWNEGYFYGLITTWCNLGAGLPRRGGRDDATIQQLNIIDLMEGNLIQNAFQEGMSQGLHYTQIMAQVNIKIKNFLNLIAPPAGLLGK